MPRTEDGLLATRLESLFSRSEYVGVDRPVEDDDNDDAECIANDMDVISLARDNKTTDLRIKFELDLPAEGEDHILLEVGHVCLDGTSAISVCRRIIAAGKR